MTNRTLTDIRENIDYVGCDNATALDLCAQIDRLTRDLAGARAEADRLNKHADETALAWSKLDDSQVEEIEGLKDERDGLLRELADARAALVAMTNYRDGLLVIEAQKDAEIERLRANLNSRDSYLVETDQFSSGFVKWLEHRVLEQQSNGTETK